MRSFLPRYLLAISVGLVGACSSGDKTTATQDSPGKPDHVWSGQVQALEKAKGVEQTLTDSAQRQAQEMEKQTGAR